MTSQDIKSVVRSNSTGIIYHEDMIDHFCLWDEDYPECPERFTKILKRCEALNLLNRCKKISTRSANLDEIQLKHSRNLINLLQSCETKNEEELEKISSCYDAVYINRDTYRLALLAVGSSLNLVNAVCTNEVRNGMAIIRPPGHHAMESAYCGYCFFNNVALAAEYALKKFNFKKILIVDWDVHHGQATQQMFYNDPRVLYFSIHRFEHGTFWPNLRESNVDYVGEGAGKGFNFNIPLNKTGLGNADYLTIFHQVLLPVAMEYQPELILVSAGYDAAVGCPEGEMEVTPACYAHLVNSLSHLANGKICVILEGGYFLKSLAEGAALSLRSLLGDACPNIGAIGKVDVSLRETILNVIYSHRNHWECFKLYDKVDVMGLPVIHYSPCIQFNYVEEVIEKFPTRDCYIKHSEEMQNYFNARIDNLIKNTKLTDSNVRSLVYSSPISKNYQHIQSCIEEELLININQDEVIEFTISSIIEKILKNVSRSVIFDEVCCGNKQNDILERIIDYLIEDVGLNRVLLVENNYSGTRQSDDRFLNVNFNCKKHRNGNTNNNFYIRYPFSDSMNDEDFLTFSLKILLPVAYQYNPEIVIVSLDFSQGSNLSLTSYSYLVHWLTCLGNGKFIFVANYDSTNEGEKSSFHQCCQVLLGDCVPALTKTQKAISTESVNSLKILIECLKKKWFNLDFIVKFVDRNDNRQ